MNDLTTPAECPVCADPLREVADLMLLSENGFDVVAKKLGRPKEYAEALKAHLWAKHARGFTKENFLILAVDYQQRARKMYERELLKRPENQRMAVFNLYHRATQWTLTSLAKMEGLMQPGAKKMDGDVIKVLNALAQGDPETVKRIAEARQKDKPILIEAKKVDGSEPPDNA